MAENRISLEGVTPTDGAIPMTMSTNSVSNPLYVTDGMPTNTLFYTHAVTEAIGVVTANNFLSIFNPVGSGKVMTFYRIVVFPWATAATATTRSMTVQRITAASGGTLIAASNISKFTTTQANSIAEVRQSNPTVTTIGLPTLSFPPAITSAGSGVTNASTIVPPTGASFHCLPGEGIVFATAAGDVDQLWNLGAAWSES